MSAFTSQFTTQVGSSKNAQQCYAVIADSYEASMHELAQVLSAQLGENERPAYVANILQECRKILPAPDSGEAITDEQRLQCLSLLTSDITKAAFNAVSQAGMLIHARTALILTQTLDTEGFVNMYLTLATPISDRLSDINAHVELFTTLLNTPSSLTTLLYILPSAINDKARLRIYEKMLTLVPADQRNATLKALFVQLPTWSTSTEDTDAFCMRTTEHWLKKGDPKMCESILRHAESSNSDLQRLRLRLALQSTTCFDFPSAPEATQENAVVEYLVSRDQQASIDENVLTSALPKLSKEALATKKTSLAIARMFSARIGHKVGYSSIAQEVLSLASTTASDELDESVEGAVIDGISVLFALMVHIADCCILQP